MPRFDDIDWPQPGKILFTEEFRPGVFREVREIRGGRGSWTKYWFGSTPPTRRKMTFEAQLAATCIAGLILLAALAAILG